MCLQGERYYCGILAIESHFVGCSRYNMRRYGGDFTDTSTMAGATQQFFFDDGSFEEGREVRKTYWDAGKYTYDFVLTNADGCADTLRDTIFVHTLPLVEFDWKKDNMVTGADILPNPEIESGGMRFTNATVIHLQDWEKDGLRYHWNFGDGNVSEEKEPAHQFANNGSYEVWLHAISGMGCRTVFRI